MQFYRRETVPIAKYEDAGGQSFNEHLPVRWGVTILTEYNFLRAEIFCHKGYQPFAFKCLYTLEIVNGYDTGVLSGQHTKNCREWGCNKQPDVGSPRIQHSWLFHFIINMTKIFPKPAKQTDLTCKKSFFYSPYAILLTTFSVTICLLLYFDYNFQDIEEDWFQRNSRPRRFTLWIMNCYTYIMK